MSSPCPPKAPAYRAAGLGSRRILPGGTQAVGTATAGAFKDLPRRRRGSEPRDSAPAKSRLAEPQAVATATAGAFRDLPPDPSRGIRLLPNPAWRTTQAVATATAGAFRDLPRRRRGSEPRDSAPAESRLADNYRAAAARRFANRSAISRAVRTASAPLSKRGSAWSGWSRVSTPNETGTPVSIAASWSPDAASPAT